jgi:hypothetical protein
MCHHIEQHHAWLLCVLWAAGTGFAGLLARQQVHDDDDDGFILSLEENTIA